MYIVSENYHFMVCDVYTEKITTSQCVMYIVSENYHFIVCDVHSLTKLPLPGVRCTLSQKITTSWCVMYIVSDNYNFIMCNVKHKDQMKNDQHYYCLNAVTYFTFPFSSK